MCAWIDTTMWFAGSLPPLLCVLTVQYPETTLFASLIRHVVRSTLWSCIYWWRGNEEGPRDRGRGREERVGDRSKRDVRLSIGTHTGVRTCTLDIDPGTWLHRSRQTPWITAGTLRDYLGPLPYCSWIGEHTHNSAPGWLLLKTCYQNWYTPRDTWR